MHSIVSGVDGNIIFVNWLFANASIPILVTLLGIVTSVSLLPKNAPPPILLTVFGIITEVIPKPIGRLSWRSCVAIILFLLLLKYDTITFLVLFILVVGITPLSVNAPTAIPTTFLPFISLGITTSVPPSILYPVIDTPPSTCQAEIC